MSRPAKNAREDRAALQLAELLLVQSLQAQRRMPELSETLARLALRVADHTCGPELCERVDRIKARAFCLAASARRLLHDAEGAEELFRQAAFHLTGPPDCEERAFYCQALARLRRDQGRTGEVSDLLWRAALLFAESGDRAGEGACLADLGFLFLEDGQPDRAMPPLARAVEALDGSRQPAQAACSRLLLALAQAALGRTDQAFRLAEEARRPYEHIDFPEPWRPGIPEGERV